MRRNSAQNLPERPVERIELAPCVMDFLQERIVVSLNGVPTKMSYAQALARRIVVDSVSGDANAQRRLIDLLRIAISERAKEGGMFGSLRNWP